MAGDDVTQTLAAMGPRLRVVRERRGVTLAAVSCATGISPSTLSRIETGRRKPTLEVVLRLAEEYGVALDELVGTAPAPAAESRSAAPHSFGDDKAVLPLTQYVGGLHAHKHVLPAVAEPPGRPRQVSHEGYEWLCVLYGRLWIALGDQDLRPDCRGRRRVRHPHPSRSRKRRIHRTGRVSDHVRASGRTSTAAHPSSRWSRDR
ncbi:hypothetical protein ALMP_71830 [Streptomyces sp. A012304]|nr:hypothetical protein ALMP_71830 [Streptomyces sp. A012304]